LPVAPPALDLVAAAQDARGRGAARRMPAPGFRSILWEGCVVPLVAWLAAESSVARVRHRRFEQAFVKSLPSMRLR
jgi:hypothetical protein